MNTPSSLRIWIGGALAAFVDGFIEGLPVGGPLGLAVATTDGAASAAISQHDTKSISLGVLHVLGLAIMTGFADVRAWKKDHSFPNIFVPDNPTTKPESQ